VFVIDEKFTRVRSRLAAAITNNSRSAGKLAKEPPMPQPGTSIAVATAYEPYRQYYLSHQRDMDMSIRPLRVNVRNALAGASPALKQSPAWMPSLTKSWVFEKANCLQRYPPFCRVVLINCTKHIKTN